MLWPVVISLLSCWSSLLASLAVSQSPPPNIPDKPPSGWPPEWPPDAMMPASVPTKCPARCRCPDQHSTVVNCHRAGLRRVPNPLPRGTIVLDLDHNRIGMLTNESLGFDRLTDSGRAATFASGHDQLEIVSVQDNGLTRIESLAFAALAQLRIVRLGGNRLTVLPVGLFDGCRRLQVLDLHGNLLVGAPPDHVVYHIHGLVSLNISRNRLTSPNLGPGFRYVTQLGDIDMSGNDFPTIESDAFSVMRYWDERVERRINLSACNIRRLHPASLLPVRHLRSISLSGNPRLPIDDIRIALRANNSSVTRCLETLDISWNAAFRTSGNPAELFSELRGAHLEHVTELDLAGSRISEIPLGAFHSLLPPSLSAVTTTLSPVNVSASGSRRGAVFGLRYLDLSWNQMTSAGVGLAEIGHTIERLRLAGNRITDIDDGGEGGGEGFKYLRRLLELDLSHNEIVRLSGTILRRGPCDLRRIDLGYNRIRDVGDDTLPIGLETLIATGNRLTDVGFLRGLPRLRDVDVSDNAIVRLGNDVFASVAFGFPPPPPWQQTIHAAHNESDASSRRPPASPTRISANFSRNQISYVEAGAFRRIVFDVLDMSDNRLATMSTFGWFSIETLFLDGNELIAVNRDLVVESDGPLELYVRRNLLGSLSLDAGSRRHNATPESRIMVLDVSDNSDIGSFLEHANGNVGSSPSSSLDFALRKLEVLRAQRTNLRRLPAEFIGAIRSLRVLDISGNRIEAVEGSSDHRSAADFTALTHLRELDLSGNKLTEFPIELLRGDGSELRHVLLADNPWRCNCSSLLLCHLPAIQRLVENDAIDEDSRDVTDRTRCGFAVSADEVAVSVSLIELCYANSVFRLRCSAHSSSDVIVQQEIVYGESRHDNRTKTVSWKLVLVAIVAMAGLTVLPLAALAFWYFGASASGRSHVTRTRRSRRCAGSGIGRTKSGGYRIVEETALSFSVTDREDAESVQPL